MVDFIRPLEGVIAFDVVSEQPLPGLPGAAELRPPLPLGIQRETGRLGVRTEDLVARVNRSDALWQVNAAPDEFAAFQFNLRPAVLHLHLSPVEPLVTASTRVRAAVEETRLLVDHRVDLNVSRAGIYGLEWGLPTDLTVAHVEGEGIEDWQSSAGCASRSFRRSRPNRTNPSPSACTLATDATAAGFRPPGCGLAVLFSCGAAPPWPSPCEPRLGMRGPRAWKRLDPQPG